MISIIISIIVAIIALIIAFFAGKNIYTGGGRKDTSYGLVPADVAKLGTYEATGDFICSLLGQPESLTLTLGKNKTYFQLYFPRIGVIFDVEEESNLRGREKAEMSNEEITFGELQRQKNQLIGLEGTYKPWEKIMRGVQELTQNQIDDWSTGKITVQDARKNPCAVEKLRDVAELLKIGQNAKIEAREDTAVILEMRRTFWQLLNKFVNQLLNVKSIKSDTFSADLDNLNKGFKANKEKLDGELGALRPKINELKKKVSLRDAVIPNNIKYMLPEYTYIVLQPERCSLLSLTSYIYYYVRSAVESSIKADNGQKAAILSTMAWFRPAYSKEEFKTDMFKYVENPNVISRAQTEHMYAIQYGLDQIGQMLMSSNVAQQPQIISPEREEVIEIGKVLQKDLQQKYPNGSPYEEVVQIQNSLMMAQESANIIHQEWNPNMARIINGAGVKLQRFPGIGSWAAYIYAEMDIYALVPCVVDYSKVSTSEASFVTVSAPLGSVKIDPRYASKVQEQIAQQLEKHKDWSLVKIVKRDDGSITIAFEQNLQGQPYKAAIVSIGAKTLEQTQRQARFVQHTEIKNREALVKMPELQKTGVSV